MTTTRGGSRRHRTGLVLAVAVAGVLAWPAAALAAEVTTTPTQATQGDAVTLHLVVPEERPGARTEKIEFRLPEATPIGEVYPLSVDGWAPLINFRNLDQPVAGIHAPGVTQVTAAVTWTRAAGKPVPGPARLSLAMGPLPQVDRMSFELVQTYSDGTVVRWADPAGGAHPAPTLALVPPAPGAAVGHDHGGAAPVVADTGQGGVAALPPAADDGGPSADVLLGGGLLIGLGGGALIGWMVSRARHRAEPDDDEPQDEPSTGQPAGGQPAVDVRPMAEPVGSR
ncbi:DUF1775 domain-containing protein [Micromonospora sp. KC606]|uniref:DUF1775 domain-containing protein n=1 Tax=Micromonospora sp. KC606 TaxID=2530379 RepID=UPI001052B30B|nr:DUF1775 domain-containing protein [Micromonospora sp. KC606]TDC85321.1 DUF1775 domain-containing protein [Micromonospora sp. KC606]